MRRRARDTEEKAERRRQIRDAAWQLFADGRGDLPTSSLIAERAGLAKGSLYVYFETKEAIFADLLLEGWGGILSEVETIFAGRGDRAGKVARFMTRLVEQLNRHPELLRLDALGPGVVERNIAPEALRFFKQALADRLVAGGTAIEQALDLPPGRGATLLMRTYSFTRGLWQSFGTAPNQAAHAGIAPFQAEFKVELSEALAEYWRGALTPATGTPTTSNARRKPRRAPSVAHDP